MESIYPLLEGFVLKKKNLTLQQTVSMYQNKTYT